MKIAYFDAFSGISGDMTVGAFLQLGVSLDALRHELNTLDLSGYRLRQTIRQRSGIQATKFEVEVHQPQGERASRAIADMLRVSALVPQVKEMALRIFDVLAQAEGHIHGVPPQDVHFHEVGAVDSIVDIVGTAFCLHTLGIEQVYVSPLPMGSGVVTSRHGILPVPGPATLELLKGFPVCLADGQSELVTPTGAAILAAVAQPGSVPAVQIEAVGYGAGERELSDRPNLLRVIIGQTQEPPRTDQLLVLETNIDDLNPEFYEHVMERVLAAGARDVFLCPIHMKKNRPGILLWVLCEVADRERLSGLLFAETSTLGIRVYPVERLALRREHKTLETRYGRVGIKLAHQPDGRIHIAPEYEDCKRCAREHDVPLSVVYEAALHQARQPAAR